MNAVLALLTWIMSVFGAVAPAAHQGNSFNEFEGPSSEGIHIINTNPRTVVALEDTHFRPSN